MIWLPDLDHSLTSNHLQTAVVSWDSVAQDVSIVVLAAVNAVRLTDDTRFGLPYRDFFSFIAVGKRRE